MSLILDFLKVFLVALVCAILIGVAILPGILILNYFPDWLDDRRKSKAKLAAAEEKEKLLAETEKKLAEREKALSQLEEDLTKKENALAEREKTIAKVEQGQREIADELDIQQKLLTIWAQAHDLLAPQIVSKAPISLEDAEA